MNNLKTSITKILPFFIPMEGCPHQCIYCDQQAVSGQAASVLPAEVARLAAAFSGGVDSELAFYGGSFSCLPLSRQEEYLAAAAPALRQGKIGGVRISTRPDGVDREELEFLASWGVTTIELGIQSFDPAVLAACGRGYRPEQAQAACLAVKEHGFRLGVQLMTGLPEDDEAKALATARRTVALAPELIRIYPTVVLENTPLAALWRQGGYLPQTLEDAALVAGKMLALFQWAHLTVIRLGLNPSPETAQAVLDGPYHPAFGQIVKAGLKLEQAWRLLAQAAQNGVPVLGYPPRELPLLTGQHNRQRTLLQQRYPGICLQPAADLAEEDLGLWQESGWKTLSYQQFLQQYLADLQILPEGQGRSAE